MTAPRERVLMISPYPPVRDGIASYALQTVRALRREGLDVEVLSPGPSAAHHHLDLRGPRGALALAKRIRDYDRVIVQFHPDFFYTEPGRAKARMVESAALMVPFALARRLEVVVHEIDGRFGDPRRPDGQVARRLWHLPESIKVHTASERDAFIADFGVDPAKVELIAHGADFRPHTHLDRAAARASLDIEPDAFVFLAIGFVQPSKGFDRAVEAFDGLAVAGARLDVVGSVRTDEPDMVRYASDLVELAEGVDGATVHLGYVSDELFDRWIVAADVVVLPYRAIWSSGVMERAALFDRPVIATRVGGLAEQAAARADVRLVDDDAELRAAMIERLPLEHVPATASWTEEVLPEGGDLRTGLQERVRERASTRPSLTRSGAAGTRAGSASSAAEVAQRSAPLRRLPYLGPPDTNHGRRSVRLVKRVLRKATAFQVDPLLARVNELQAATIRALEAEARAAQVREVETRGVEARDGRGAEAAGS
ncbi:glycosyltransferase family 4 protein [Blastococcus sp. TML/M2B]|uniref:glycosyltransferase family 4 protein n=1 Tax=unclassified Blastococcus TaxID=2619396 RepID=UPI00190C2F24|nr:MULTISPECIES: glycosyltransferase family 4 protein [unclassified Blastococcus]MBN1093817.1 glycosyltransferase family 4 protein [Blastococcus sp. TML/M2B]MBN1096060.1 glycosyltransferase family 4 protein [Blastococcus sp. TML/C7B]